MAFSYLKSVSVRLELKIDYLRRNTYVETYQIYRSNFWRRVKANSINVYLTFVRLKLACKHFAFRGVGLRDTLVWDELVVKKNKTQNEKK